MLANRIRMVYGGEALPSWVDPIWAEYLATDDDFSGTSDGEFKYIGNKNTVYIPHVIKGVEVTSYKRMFGDIDKFNSMRVISDNVSVTDMSWMFAYTSMTSLDLTNFDTSSVTSMSLMFQSSSATVLDLSSFDTSLTPRMHSMFQFAAATTGYARTLEDASRFNNSENKSGSLWFSVK